ncbi:hypothetical protein V2A60_009377 [Cordyceps javanica]|uniref:Amine oxidase n=1 Tax=Cordyceps javanica TaxID=43265 RepID=A0A545UNZ0_9HYPO|nr:amine oxidase [Cordyceps javanica]TQW03017.1 amine oxidase [Cordyceps javanica]
MTTSSEAQVIVIGAGLSGLTAASELQRRGFSVIVLEASSRVGGRAYSVDTRLGSHIDLGGQWIGRGHHRLADLVTKAGGTPYKTYTRGLPVIIYKNRTVPIYSPSALLAIAYLVFIELASRIYIPQSWLTLTIDKFIEGWVPLEVTRRLLLLVIAITSTAELENSSLYAFARAARVNGGLLAMTGTEGGAQDSLTVEAMGNVTSMLAQELSQRILTDSPATSVSQSSAGKTVVTTASGRQFHASKVIVAVPPPMLKSISFSPPMPAERKALQENTRMGVVYKALAIYEKPFWRDGLGGEFLVLDDPSFGVFDTTPPGAGGPGHLCFLVASTPARQLDALDAKARQELLLSRLSPFLGRRVMEPADWHEKAWHQDEHCGGGYMAFALAGTREGLLPMPRKSVGNVHWAGTETAEEHPGYLEGAIQAGDRAAHEVAQAIGSASGPDN